MHISVHMRSVSNLYCHHNATLQASSCMCMSSEMGRASSELMGRASSELNILIVFLYDASKRILDHMLFKSVEDAYTMVVMFIGEVFLNFNLYGFKVVFK